MSSHSNNGNDNVNLHPFPPIYLNERVGVVDSWWDTIFTLPSFTFSSRFPPPRMRLVVFRDNLANNRNLRSQPIRREDSDLTPDEQRIAFEKLKKEIYNPVLKKIIRRLGRQNGASKGKKTEEDDDEEDKTCVICLENFEAREVVTVTPCNHRFHGECILRWLKSNERCPVCRFSFCQRTRASPTNDGNNALTNDLSSFGGYSGATTTATTRPSWF